MDEDEGKRAPVKFAALLFFEKFNWASRGRKGRGTMDDRGRRRDSGFIQSSLALWNAKPIPLGSPLRAVGSTSRKPIG